MRTVSKKLLFCTLQQLKYLKSCLIGGIFRFRDYFILLCGQAYGDKCVLVLLFFLRRVKAQRWKKHAPPILSDGVTDQHL